MAKPIEYIENDEKNNLSVSDLIPDEYRESFNNLLKTVKNLNDSGFFSMINAVIANYKYIIDTLSEQLESENTKKATANLFNILSLLSKLDTDKTFNYINRLGDAINSIKIDDSRHGIMEIIRTMNSNDTSRLILTLLKILSDAFEKDESLHK